ncbi:MAG TPA: hypothetical protein VGO69_11815 [Pyrinomonadaceae bacterium]|nr:hypothetical protein [Pyrinomonadaceae bacterium]
MSVQKLIFMILAAVVLFIAATFFTRAKQRRALAALVGGIVGTLCGELGDIAGYHLGLWHYAGATPSHAPQSAYVAVSLAVGGAALVGWRVSRRFGLRGLAIFICVIGVLSTIGDIVADALVGMQTLSPGWLPLVGDVILWVIVHGVAQGVMQLMAGPAADDGLSRTRA